MSDQTTKPTALGDAKRWLAGEISLGRFIHNSSLESCYAQASDFAGGIANAFDEKIAELTKRIEQLKRQNRNLLVEQEHEENTRKMLQARIANLESENRVLLAEIERKQEEKGLNDE